MLYHVGKTAFFALVKGNLGKKIEKRALLFVILSLEKTKTLGMIGKIFNFRKCESLVVIGVIRSSSLGVGADSFG